MKIHPFHLRWICACRESFKKSSYMYDNSKTENHFVWVSNEIYREQISFDCMNNAGKKAWAVFKLNTAWSLKYMHGMSTTSLFIALLHLLMSNKHDAQECHLCCPMLESKQKYMTKNLHLFQQVDYFCWFGYLNQLGKYTSVYLIPFQTHWK